MLSTFLKSTTLQGGDALVFAGGYSALGAGSSPSFTLTSLTGGIDTRPRNNDIIIACISISDTTARSFSASGYTRLISLKANGTTYDSQLAVFYKIATGTESSILISGLTISQDSWFCVHVWRGINTTTPFDVTSVTNTVSGTGKPDASPITTITNNSIVLAIGSEASNSSTVLTAPSGMINKFDYTSSGSGVVIASVKVPVAGTYDPGVFGGGSTSTAASACAVTMALRTS